MMDEHRGRPSGSPDLDATQREALEAVEGLCSPPVSASARARTRAAFVEGLESQAPPLAGVAARTPVTRRRRPGPRTWAAAAAVVAVAAVLAYGFLPAAPWVVSRVTGPDRIEHQGRSHLVAAGEILAPGSLHVDAETELELTLGELVLRTRGETRFELPPAPGHWFRRDRTLRLTEGEVYGSSGESAPAFQLRLRTPEAVAHLTGTTFAVFRTEQATCFCLYRGGLEVEPLDTGERIDLPVGNRIYVYRDGRPPEIQPLDAGETMKLRMIDDVTRQPDDGSE